MLARSTQDQIDSYQAQRGTTALPPPPPPPPAPPARPKASPPVLDPSQLDEQQQPLQLQQTQQQQQHGNPSTQHRFGVQDIRLPPWTQYQPKPQPGEKGKGQTLLQDLRPATTNTYRRVGDHTSVRDDPWRAQSWQQHAENVAHAQAAATPSWSSSSSSKGNKSGWKGDWGKGQWYPSPTVEGKSKGKARQSWEGYTWTSGTW